MQKLWKVVLEGNGCDEKQKLAMRLRFGRGTRAVTLDDVRFAFAESGFTNGGGKPYSRERVKQFAYEGLCSSLAFVCDRSRVGEPVYEARIEKAVAELTRMKRHYSCSTEADPYLKGRLEWWRLRKVGKKWNSSRYDRKRYKK